jgi:acyl carrier protein
MSKKDLYKKVFQDTFSLGTLELEKLSYQSIPAWDSVGHMELMTVLEDTFNVQLDIDDIIDFSSFQKGIEILQKNGVTFE